MGEPDAFMTTLRTFMTRALRSPSDLERLTGISARTIENWVAGVVRRPREVVDVLKIAHALGLDVLEASALLSSAGYPPLPTLWAQAQRATDGVRLDILRTWGSELERGVEHHHQEQQQPQLETPAPATSALRHQLRPPVADFVGRRHEAQQLVTALQAAVSEGAGVMISGVQGMGGIGKTELAYAVAHQLRDAFPDAQIVLPLYGSSATPLTAVQAIQAVIRAFTPEARLPEDLPALEQHYRSLLHGQRVLILADDAADAAQVRALLPPAGSALLLTSQQRFALPGMQTVQLEQLDEATAVTLLRRLAPRLNADEAEALAQLCGHLPLALRVCGSMLHTTPALSVADYLAGLADERQRLDQLRDPDDPQLDVAAVLVQSYAQLDGRAQAVFRQLGALVADFTADLAQAVVVAPEVDLMAMLRHLLRRNLVMYDAQHRRWRLHDLVRDLARRLLEAAGEDLPADLLRPADQRAIGADADASRDAALP